MENTKPIPNHSDYHVTPDGRIYSAKLRPGWCTPQIDKLGYHTYWLHNGKKKYRLYAHRAVALTYLPNPENKPHINHLDNDPTNNRLDNLQWCTHKENMQHAARQGRTSVRLGEDNKNSKMTVDKVKKIRQLYEHGIIQTELSRIFGIKQCTVSQIIRRVTWRSL